jgi:hypothetical protein
VPGIRSRALEVARAMRDYVESARR